jgi:hypothetical protein
MNDLAENASVIAIATIIAAMIAVPLSIRECHSEKQVPVYITNTVFVPVAISSKDLGARATTSISPTMPIESKSTDIVMGTFNSPEFTNILNAIAPEALEDFWDSLTPEQKINTN